MPRHAHPLSPRPRRHQGSKASMSKADWRLLCEITAHRIVENGFRVNWLYPHTSLQIGAELETGVTLIVSAGAKGVGYLEHTAPGVSEGLKDMAKEGLDGRMILYGMAFHFIPAA
ncbi:hypothetical protein F5B22DRAFT_469158 [Xylaria bambusicola]|uniref:uncharacterized protein n=1 Tax=Xylaria bambusicola TaxID=326684 RepID=UPI0020075D77|nr:uncharacterized protein F5B22DRAFT_469158 [Xylaria bambusicola]KAI0522289.1 hypothetical protein F5B22DRAFT_469158 [Xylaria bambusicola]